jgi:hypothetical protein
MFKKSRKHQQRKAIKTVKSRINQIRNNILFELEIFETNGSVFSDLFSNSVFLDIR